MARFVLFLSGIAGATFALFTSNAKVNLSITSAKVKLLNATIENKKMYSLTEVNPDTLEGTEEDRTAAGTFYLGGTAEFEGNTLTLKKMAPGDRIAFDVKVDNESDIPVKYRVLVKEDGGSNLYKLHFRKRYGKSIFGMDLGRHGRKIRKLHFQYQR